MPSGGPSASPAPGRAEPGWHRRVARLGTAPSAVHSARTWGTVHSPGARSRCPAPEHGAQPVPSRVPGPGARGTAPEQGAQPAPSPTAPQPPHLGPVEDPQPLLHAASTASSASSASAASPGRAPPRSAPRSAEPRGEKPGGAPGTPRPAAPRPRAPQAGLHRGQKARGRSLPWLRCSAGAGMRLCGGLAPKEPPCSSVL